ncbi:hypothetical protein AS9A_P20117 (plasmid) [Hoyosella subflava DQS3-9A1]|uniref:Uncharacterized protein n=1 Tax=Hoyosella subflava (strain DSM 45089 / JCM 17490 / NBRC 109087 / DQS3-9A1) TaxID=443218 RepID=F6ESP0_HOYSD|nr:hypothetical protein AS9A_P20117 [Hoyosella subflava DQS3-9A1]
MMSWQTADGVHEGYAAIEVAGRRLVTAFQGDSLILDDENTADVSATVGWLARCTCGPLMIEHLTDRYVASSPTRCMSPKATRAQVRGGHLSHRVA